MLDTPDTPDTLKSQAKRLAAHLKKKYGWNMPLGGSLEAIAAARGYRDWNTCVAALFPEKPVDRPIAIPAQQTKFAALFIENAIPTMEEVVSAALAENITDIRLPATPHSEGANLIYVHSQGKYSLPISLTSAQLTAFVRTATLGLGNSRAGDSSGQYGVTVDEDEVFVRWTLVPLGGEHLLVLGLRPEPKYPDLFEKDEFLDAVMHTRGKLYLVAGLTGQGKTTSVRTIASRLLNAAKPVVYVHPQYVTPVSGAVSFPFEVSALEVLEAAVQYARNHEATHLVLSHSIRGMEEAAVLHKALEAGITVVAEVLAPSVQGACEFAIEKFSNGKELGLNSFGGIRRQTLLPKTCAECTGAGCATCANKGTLGLVLTFENVVFAQPGQLESVRIGEVRWHSMAAHARKLAKAGLVSKKLVNSRFSLVAEK